jgi:hypothetical protein
MEELAWEEAFSDSRDTGFRPFLSASVSFGRSPTSIIEGCTTG